MEILIREALIPGMIPFQSDQGPVHDSDVEAIYRPLKSATATRCARFDVDKFARTGKLHCLLEEVDLKRKPLEYAAISYTWIGSCGRRLSTSKDMDST